MEAMSVQIQMQIHDLFNLFKRTNFQNSIIHIVVSKNGFLWCLRKEFQREHRWEKFKCIGKIYWGEGK